MKRHVYEELSTMNNTHHFVRPGVNNVLWREIQKAFHARTNHPNVTQKTYFSEVPLAHMSPEEQRAYSDLLVELMDVCENYLDRHANGIPAEKISELMTEIQLQCVEPFLRSRASATDGNEYIQALGSQVDAKHGGVTLFGTVLPVALGRKVYNYYLKQMMIVWSHVDANGIRVTGDIPAHAHAANIGYSHAVVPHSPEGAVQGKLREDLYRLLIRNTNESAILQNGEPHPSLQVANGTLDIREVVARKIKECTLPISRNPISFVEVADPDQQLNLDRFQRPHSVSAELDVSKSSPVMMPTYFGPDARTTPLIVKL